MTPEIGIYAAWTAWIVSWIAAAGWASAPAKTAGWSREFPYRAVQIAGFLALFTFRGGALGRGSGVSFFLYQPLWTLQPDVGWLMVALAMAGFAFCWWARLHLGRLWSGTVTRKEGHRVVDTGPYGIVRHPIYTGLLLAIIAMAVIRATPLALFGSLMIAVAFVLKARLEETFLGEELGRETYDAYRRRVPMLVPFAPTAR